MCAVRALTFCALSLLAVARGIHGQAQTLLSQDFENGLSGWTPVGPTSLWHVAANGECGAISSMVACNHGPGACDYAVSSGKYLDLHSPPFKLTGSPPWTFSFDYLKSTDVPGEVAALYIEHLGGDGIFSPLALGLVDANSIEHVAIVNSFSDYWWGQSVRLNFSLHADAVGNQGFGWLVDNVRVTNGGGWWDLANAKDGSAGTPTLVGTGTLSANSGNQLDLAAANPSSMAAMFFGFVPAVTSFKGGTLVPAPQLVIPLVTDTLGNATLPFTMPPNLPPAVSLYFQVWIQDAGASNGFAASNGLKGVTS